ncbi:hypothetical protein AOC36_06885 [Erysipelothrix larvae]|uniref:Uncharacterized protein n=1 Tax=Erysipelothrix larvae TaxID=1514105 RepID=A0A0X8H0C1_9FIRM|nr:hypothetical protein [Erysipelothrix larvae]AMC93716.1 hypothetical protein AOC36_06885 [Erysipelothrix larvae]
MENHTEYYQYIPEYASFDDDEDLCMDSQFSSLYDVYTDKLDDYITIIKDFVVSYAKSVIVSGRGTEVEIDGVKYNGIFYRLNKHDVRTLIVNENNEFITLDE